MTSSTRMDPINDVMPYELLKVAHDLVERGQNEGYWANVPVPVRPDGWRRFEVVQQLATFVIPLLCLDWASLHYGLKGLLLGVPVAGVIGFLLDLWLEKSIDAKMRFERKRDAGRYRAVKWLCQQMGMRPEEVTLDIIHKMNKDYVAVKYAIDTELARRAAERKATAVRVHRCEGRSPDTGRYEPTAVRVVQNTVNYANEVDHTPAYSPGEVTIAYDSEGDYMAEHDYGTTINPGSNLPMIGDTGIDVHGNAFGQFHQY